MDLLKTKNPYRFLSLYLKETSSSPHCTSYKVSFPPHLSPHFFFVDFVFPHPTINLPHPEQVGSLSKAYKQYQKPYRQRVINQATQKFKKNLPWLVWLSGLSDGLQTKV